MPRFYFNLRRDDVIEVDRNGRELPRPTLAFQEAVLAASQKLTSVNGQPFDNHQIEVTDCWGKLLFTVPLSSVTSAEAKVSQE